VSGGTLKLGFIWTLFGIASRFYVWADDVSQRATEMIALWCPLKFTMASPMAKFQLRAAQGMNPSVNGHISPQTGYEETQRNASTSGIIHFEQ
jgi:hypothetical protein